MGVSVPSLGVLPQSKIDQAQFPQLYLGARKALQECARIDEVKTMQDKTQALATYAKQAQNKELQVLARRISLRAERRMGQILHSMPKTRGGRGSKGTGRKRDAERAGLNVKQYARALKIAAIDAKVFEGLVESPTPPSRQQLGEQLASGIQRNTQWANRVAMTAALRGLVVFCESHHPAQIATAFSQPDMQAGLSKMSKQCIHWLQELLRCIEPKR
jgi:hypothetical protein